MQQTPETIALHVPFRVAKRSGEQREVYLPKGAPVKRRTDNTLDKALACAFRCKRMLALGAFHTITELAESDGDTPPYMTRVLRKTLLAPDIVDMILYGKQDAGVRLENVLEPFSLVWAEQRAYSL